MNDFTLADQDWIGLMIFKNLRIRAGSDSISSDQDWTRTEKLQSPLVSARHAIFSVAFVSYQRWDRIWITGFDSGRILRFSFGPGSGVKNLGKTGPGVSFQFRQQQ